MPIIKKPFTLSPLNDNPVVLASDFTVSGGFSHKDGFPTVKFSVPPQPAFLETSTLRVVGQILIKDGDNKYINSDTTGAVGGKPNSHSDGTANAGKISDNNATGAGGGLIKMNDEVNVNFPNWGGVKNVIEKVVVQSKKTLIEISTVNNYSQYTSLQEVYTNNENDYKQSPYSRCLTTGKNAGLTNRHIVASAKFDSTMAGADAAGEITPPGGAAALSAGSQGGMGSLANANDKMIGQFFSIPINVDLLNAGDLNIDDNFLGGLLITLHLNPDSALLHSRYRTFKTTDPTATPINNFSYTLKNLKLEGRYIIPTPEEMNAYPQAMMLGSRLNLINDIHSSVNSNSYTPQLQMVKGIASVFLDNDQTNNSKKNSNNFRKPVGEKSYVNAKNGLKFPVNYEVKNVPNWDNPTNETGNGVSMDVSTLQHKCLGYGDAEVRKYFDKSLMDGMEPYHSSADFTTTCLAMESDYRAAAGVDGERGFGNNTNPDAVGVGTDFTLGLGLQSNFVNQDYNLTLKSGVNTGNAKLPESRNGSSNVNPLLQQSFVRHASQFDTVNLVKVI